MTTHSIHVKPSILALDDDPIMLLFLHEYLKDDYNLFVFDQGRDAVNWLRRGNSVDSIIADLNMPEMHGLEFLEEIRWIDHVASTPLLILSGSQKSADRVAGLRADAEEAPQQVRRPPSWPGERRPTTADLPSRDRRWIEPVHRGRRAAAVTSAPAPDRLKRRKRGS